MKELLQKNILITRVQDAHVELKEKLIIGELDKLACGSIDKISDALINILNSLGAKANSEPFFDIDKSLVGRRISIYECASLDVKNIAESFLLNIQSSNQTTHLLFNQLSKTHEEAIRNEMRNFLAQNGNKQIKEGLQVIADDASIKLAGRYGKNKIDIVDDEPPETHCASVDGVFKNNRVVNLQLDSNKYITAYFDQKDLDDLLCLIKSNTRRKFTTQDRYDAKGVKDKYLNFIEDAGIPVSPQEELFI